MINLLYLNLINMNRLIELVLDTNELYSNFSESESHFLTNISFAIKEKIT